MSEQPEVNEKLGFQPSAKVQLMEEFQQGLMGHGTGTFIGKLNWPNKKPKLYLKIYEKTYGSTSMGDYHYYLGTILETGGFGLDPKQLPGKVLDRFQGVHPAGTVQRVHREKMTDFNLF